jgi:hypothetical protein
MEILSKIFKGDLRHAFYDKSVQMYEALRVHANGEFPEKLIGERRPKESPDIQEYRKKIYEPITMEPWGKVRSSLNKIRKSSDWGIRYSSEGFPKAIKEDETPEQYFEKKFPVYGSVTSWVFAEALPNYMMDANAWIVTIPLVYPVPPADYLRPYPYIFNSDKALWIPTPENNFLVLKAEVIGGKDGDEAFWVITDQTIARYFKEYSKDAVIQWEYPHNRGYIPAFQTRGLYLASHGTSILYMSRFYAMLPRLNEAAREYSDLQAEIVQHIFSEPWMIQSPNCPSCNGIGKTKGKNDALVSCKNCKGSGYTPATYGTMIVNPASLAERGTNLPIPPKGFVEKSTEIAKLQDERVDGHIYKALASVNFEFLAQTPLSNTSEGKVALDKEELNNTVHSVAEDLVMIEENYYWHATDMRYAVVIEDNDLRKALLPLIPVPERLEMLNAMHKMVEIKEAKDSGIAAASMAELQIEYASSKFYNNPEVRERVESTYSLDPFLGYDVDEKNAMEMNGTALKRDIVISNYLNAFVTRAISEDKKFLTKKHEEKVAVIQKYAEEKMAEIGDSEPEPVIVEDVVEA